MGTPALLRMSVNSLTKLASNHASERIRMLIKKQVILSKRERSWFKLEVQERSIVDLALSLKVSFKSSELLRALVSIFGRLRQMGSRPFGELLARGSRLAWSFSEAAVSWGNAAAKRWRSDTSYMVFLGIFSQPTRT
ncbi:MAG: hypothetical protein OK456_10605 [Thaumarchaeota archaeon]|nr:hypothetical protein [Nitrososphaerota archaeon]